MKSDIHYYEANLLFGSLSWVGLVYGDRLAYLVTINKSDATHVLNFNFTRPTGSENVLGNFGKMDCR